MISELGSMAGSGHDLHPDRRRPIQQGWWALSHSVNKRRWEAGTLGTRFIAMGSATAWPLPDVTATLSPTASAQATKVHQQVLKLLSSFTR